MTEEDYNKYIPKKKGRIKKKITFEKMQAYKIKEETFLYKYGKYFFRMKVEEDKGLIFVEHDYSTRNIELIAIRDKDGKIQYTSHGKTS